jgi:hypothetical protein
MANHMTSPNGYIFSVYGDPAYPLGDGYIIPPYRGGALSRNQMIFNKRMSAVRIMQFENSKCMITFQR